MEILTKFFACFGLTTMISAISVLYAQPEFLDAFLYACGLCALLAVVWQIHESDKRSRNL